MNNLALDLNTKFNRKSLGVLVELVNSKVSYYMYIDWELS